MAQIETFPAQPPGVAVAHFRRKWASIVALGVLFLIGGLFALAHVFVATVVAIIYIGAAMVVAGGWEVVTAFQIRPWGRALLLAVVGVATIVAGVATARFPILAAVSFTALIGALLIAGGLLKLALAWQLRDLGRSELVAVAGALGLLLGLLILAEWPQSGLYVLGLFLGVNLLFEGIAWIAMGLAARPVERRAA
jgi:uncharacterized membrane protein HdeD (DUF308 family)